MRFAGLRVRPVFVILLLIAPVLAAGVFAEEAEDDSGTVFQLSEIVVEGTQDPAQAVQTVQEITADDIRATGARTVADAIRLAVGTRVDTAPTSLGGNGKQESLVSLRGFDPRDVIVLIDGVPTYEPYSRMLDLKQIPAADIAKIKIIKGPAGVLYGPNGLGGVINIVTKKGAGRTKGHVEGSYGDVDTFYGAGSVLGAKNGFTYYFAPQFEKSDGWRISDDFDKTRNEDGGLRENSDSTDFALSGRFGYEAPGGSVSVAAGHSEYDGGVPFSMEAIDPSTLWRERWEKTTVSLHGDALATDYFYLRGAAFFTRYYNTITTYEDTTVSQIVDDGDAVSTYDNDVSGAMLMPEFDLGGGGTITLSGIYKLDRAKTQDAHGAKWNEYGAETYSGAAQYAVRVSIVDLSAGAAYHFHRRTKTPGEDLGEDNGAFDATAGVAVTPLNWLTIYAAGARKTSFADLRSLYGSSGNPDLEPELAWNVDAGVRLAPIDELGLEAAWFYSDVTDLIGKRDTGNEFTLENVDEATILGVEAIADVSALDGILGGSVGYTYLKTRDERPERNLESLDYRPESTLSVDLRVRAPWGTNLSAQYQYVSKRRYEKAGRGHVVAALPEYGLVDLRLGHVFSWNEDRTQLELYARAANLFDTYYQMAPDRASPGRMLEAGVIVDF